MFLDQTRATKELLAEVNRHQTDLNKLAERKNDTGSYDELKPVTFPEENSRRITTLRSQVETNSYICQSEGLDEAIGHVKSFAAKSSLDNYSLEHKKSIHVDVKPINQPEVGLSCVKCNTPDLLSNDIYLCNNC